MSKTFNEIFSDNLRYYLDLKQKTQADLAKYIGVSTAATNTWCKGSKVPRIEKIDKICTFLNIKRSDLMEDKANTENANQADYFIEDANGNLVLVETLSAEGNRQHRLRLYGLSTNIAIRLLDAFNSADDITKAMVCRILGLDTREQEVALEHERTEMEEPELDR